MVDIHESGERVINWAYVKHSKPAFGLWPHRSSPTDVQTFFFFILLSLLHFNLRGGHFAWHSTDVSVALLCPRHKTEYLTLTFIGPCIANIFSEYNQQDATFLNLFISLRTSTCFRRVFRPSSGAQNCTCRVRYFSDWYCYRETAVAQWLRCCATNRKVAGSIPTSVSVFFIDIKSLWSHYGPGVDSASNRNEYQVHFLGVKSAGA